MKKKYAAGFVASLIALGIAISTIDTLQETSADTPNTLSLTGVVAAADVDNVRNHIAKLFCMTQGPEDGGYTECVRVQSQMFSRKLSVNGQEPATHYAAGWRWSENQFAALEAIREKADLRVSLSTQDHPCIAGNTCGDIEVYDESFEDMLKKIGVRTMGSAGEDVSIPGRGPPEEIPFGGRGPPGEVPPEDIVSEDSLPGRGPPGRETRGEDSETPPGAGSGDMQPDVP
jgi:hypothetical protein